ncbi:MAG TPA: nicotinate-nucleotide--dimethylbenzimidazole phosphoribosyltransferase, partial [Mycobacterium sp.]|nr:nicotinate-nucleotide--dimethylbenzimidazole phosphoribosyltransferase [Mycobacterium sp.]
EPVAVVGFGTGIDDAGWSRKTAAVRDALFRTRQVLPDPVGLLRCCGGADLAAMAGFCAQAAVRRTPLLLDGMAVTAAALVAERLAPGARRWWQAGHRSTEPGHALALAALELDPILDLRMRLGEGTGATAALPLLRCAVAALSSMATFNDAGVSTRSGGAPPP